jgi:prephenate dehydrogenase
VVIAAPPLASLEIVDALSGAETALSAGTIVTDVVSTKVAITDRARSRGLRFVGGHPLAGREATGYAAADPSLFRDRPWVLVPPEPSDEDAMEVVRGLVRVCGGRVVELAAAEHDRAVAGISHLPLLVSAALAEAVSGGPSWPVGRSLAAGGWASMTRLARGDVEMGTGMLVTNEAEVAARLRDLVAVLAGWADDLVAVDSAARVRDRLARSQVAIEEEPR